MGMETNETQKARGRPPRNPNLPPLIRAHVSLDKDLLDWAARQRGGLSGTVRACLERMKQQAERPSAE